MAPQEAGRDAVAVRGNDCVVDQVAQDKTGGERGLAGHRVGDVCRKHRDHHGDAGHADGVKTHHQRVRDLHAVGAGGTGCQREGEKYAADNDDGDKIGNAGIECIEQRLTRIGKDRLLGRRCRGLRGSGDGLLLCLGLGLGRVNGATVALMISTAWSMIFTGSAITSEVPTFRNLPSAIFCSKRSSFSTPTSTDSSTRSAESTSSCVSSFSIPRATLSLDFALDATGRRIHPESPSGPYTCGQYPRYRRQRLRSSLLPSFHRVACARHRLRRPPEHPLPFGLAVFSTRTI